MYPDSMWDLADFKASTNSFGSVIASLSAGVKLNKYVLKKKAIAQHVQDRKWEHIN